MFLPNIKNGSYSCKNQDEIQNSFFLRKDINKNYEIFNTLEKNGSNQCKYQEDIKNSFFIRKKQNQNYQIINSLQGINGQKLKKCNIKFELSQLPKSLIIKQKNTSLTDRQIKQNQQDSENIRILRNLSKDTDMYIWDKQNHKYNSEKAGKELYHYYKNIDKVLQQKQIDPTIKNSAFSEIVTKIDDIVLPSKLGLLTNKNEEKTLQITNQKYGDRYMNALSQAMQCCPEIIDYQIQDNRISQDGAQQFLNISSNNIGKIGSELLYKHLSNQNELQCLNLSNNQLGDKNLDIIIDGLMYSHNKIKTFNISKNQLTNNSSEKIANFLNESNCLQELYLHWNKIKSEGFIAIFKQLSHNLILKVLDVSWNKGGDQNISSSNQISDFLKYNKNLVHLDLSNNLFNLKESKTIAESLNQYNRSLYGFHFSGNYGYIDQKGFLVFDEIYRNDRYNYLDSRIKGIEPINKDKKKDQEIFKDTCWICDGYQEHTFQWIPGESGVAKNKPIYIYLQFENYKQQYMGKAKPDGIFYYTRMIPFQDVSQYFFYDNQQICIAQDQNIKNVQ